MNLMMLLEMAADAYGDRVAITNGVESISYRGLFEAAGRVARSLAESDARHLATLDVSSFAVPVGLFGAAWAGVPFAPLNYRLTGGELDALIGQLDPCRLITDDERAKKLVEREGAGLEVWSRSRLLAHAVESTHDPHSQPWSMDPEDIAILLFTSGTTGAPKAAVLRHKHLVSYILGSVEFASADEGEAGLMCVPPYHIAGMAAISSAVYSGRRIVQLPNFTPEGWIELARQEAVTHAFVVPTMLSRIVDLLDGESDAGLPSLRALSYGGGKMPLPVIEKAMKLFPNTDFTNAYGLTETSSTLTLLGPDDHREAAGSDTEAGRRRLVSVGRPLPTVEIEIRDADGKPLGPGEVGEIHVRGEQVSGEYRGKGSLVAEDGFFNTRDGGYLDEEGYLFLEGRLDDVIVRGGENMSPGEIENVLIQNPAVVDAAVVGVPSEEWGEAVAAMIVTSQNEKPTVAELQQWVKERLRSSRAPERIEFVEELPYNETGKLLRREVRRMLLEDA
jgi:acyl-CoA synthetase (AMP-forming)/AMP-acid ligase II